MIEENARGVVIDAIVKRRSAEFHAQADADLDAGVQVAHQTGERLPLSTDKTLGEMTAALAEARRLAADLEAEPGAATADTIGGFVDSLFEDDAARAKDLLRQALDGAREAGSQPAADTVERVERALVTREAVRQLEKDYPQIAADPVARRVADEFLWQGLAEIGIPARLDAVPINLIATAIDRAGAKTIDWMRSKASPKQQRSEPVASGARSASDVIEAMSAARHQRA